jgi:hypothetical protein
MHSQTLGRIGAVAIDAHLALAHQTVDAAAWNGAEELQQELIQTPAGLIGVDLDVTHAEAACVIRALRRLRRIVPCSCQRPFGL